VIEELNEQTRERINKAIANIRLIATRVKRLHILDAVGRAEVVVNLLNEFRQHVNAIITNDQSVLANMPFRYNQGTAERIVQALFQTDVVYSFMTIKSKKVYDQEHMQVYLLLENIHAYVTKAIEKGNGHA
jgi:nucleoside-triphosphatase THEP1